MEKDALDKVLEMEDPKIEDEDQTADKDPAPAAEDPNADPNGEPEGEAKEPTLEETVAELKGKLEEYERKNKGLYHAKQEEKTKRQQFEQQLSDVTGKYSEIVGYIKALKDSKPEPKQEKEEPPIAPVEFDDDGNSRVDLSPALKYFNKEIAAIKKEISNLGSQSSKEVKELKEREKRLEAEREAQEENERTINSIVSEKPEWEDARPNFEKAWKWMNTRLAKIQEEKGIGQINTSIAFDLLEEEGVDAEFAKAYPNVNFERVVRAYDTDKTFRRALSEFAKKEAPKEDPEQLKKLTGKPSNLASAANRKGPSVDIMDELEGLNFNDILESDDATVEKLLKAVAKASD